MIPYWVESILADKDARYDALREKAAREADRVRAWGAGNWGGGCREAAAIALTKANALRGHVDIVRRGVPDGPQLPQVTPELAVLLTREYWKGSQPEGETGG